ncbi:MAG: shikimate dehydrogenase [Betaproteobacteria bacterium]
MSDRILLGLIGAGIQRSLSPKLHAEEGRHHGLEVEYRLLDLDVLREGNEALPRLLEQAAREGYRGLNITFPAKQAVIALLDELTEEARAIGAVNTVVRDGGRFLGCNTDGSGWSWGFRRALPDADLAHVVLLGAGGAGAACADAVLRLGAEQLSIFDQDSSRAAALAARLNDRRARAAGDLATALRSASGLIHATPTGMAKMPGLPLDVRLLRPQMWVSDIVYVPLDTPLLQAARRAGCRTMDGGHMNVGQAVRGFRLFTGLDADPARMEAHFRSFVA